MSEHRMTAVLEGRYQADDAFRDFEADIRRAETALERLDGRKAEVELELDSRRFETELRELERDIERLDGRRMEVRADLNTRAFDRAVRELDRDIQRFESRRIDLDVDLDVRDAGRALARLEQDIRRLDRANPNITVEVRVRGEAELRALEARLRALDSMRVNVTVGADTGQAAAQIAVVARQAEDLDRLRPTVHVDARTGEAMNRLGDVRAEGERLENLRPTVEVTANTQNATTGLGGVRREAVAVDAINPSVTVTADTQSANVNLGNTRRAAVDAGNSMTFMQGAARGATAAVAALTPGVGIMAAQFLLSVRGAAALGATLVILPVALGAISTAVGVLGGALVGLVGALALVGGALAAVVAGVALLAAPLIALVKSAGDSANAMKEQETAAKQAESQSQAYEAALQGLDDATRGVGDAQRSAAEGVAAARKQYTDSAEATQEAARAVRDAHVQAAEGIAQAEKQHRDSVEATAQAELGVVDAHREAAEGIAQAHKQYRDSAEATALAERSLGDVHREAAESVTQAKKAYVDASRAVADSERGVTDARRQAAEGAQQAVEQYRSAAEATRRAEEDLNRARQSHAGTVRDLTAAQQSLNMAMMLEPERVIRTELDLQQARLNQKRVVLDMAAAEKQLADARRSGDPMAVRQAELGLEQLRINQRRGTLDAADAERRLADTRKNGSQELQSARRGVESASKAEKDARRGVADAERQVMAARKNQAEAFRGIARAQAEGARRIADGERNLAKAREAQGEAFRGIARAQAQGARRVADAERAVTKARQAQAEAFRGIARAQEQGQRRIANAERNLAKAREAQGEAFRGIARAQAQGARRVADAEQNLAKARERQQAAYAGIAKAQQDGARRIADAQRAVARAQEQVARAAQQMARGQNKATDQSELLWRAMIKIFPNLQRLRTEFNRAFGPGSAASRGVQRLGNEIIGLAAGAMPRLGRASADMSRAAQRALNILQREMNTPIDRSAVNQVLTSMPRVFGNITLAVGRFGGGLVNVLATLSPYTERFSGHIARIAQQFHDWSRSAEGREQIRRFMDAAVPIAASLGRMIWNVAGALLEVGVKHGPSVVGIFDWLNKWLPRVIGFFGDVFGVLGKVAHAYRQIDSAGRSFQKWIWGFIIDFGKQILDWFGRQLPEGLRMGTEATFGALVKPFKDAYDWLVGNSLVPDLVNGITDWWLSLPERLWDVGQDIYDKATGPFREAYKTIVGESIVPDLVRDVASHLNTMPDKAEVALKDLPGKVGRAFANAAAESKLHADEIADIEIPAVQAPALVDRSRMLRRSPEAERRVEQMAHLTSVAPALRPAGPDRADLAPVLRRAPAIAQQVARRGPDVGREVRGMTTDITRETTRLARSTRTDADALRSNMVGAIRSVRRDGIKDLKELADKGGGFSRQLRQSVGRDHQRLARDIQSSSQRANREAVKSFTNLTRDGVRQTSVLKRQGGRDFEELRRDADRSTDRLKRGASKDIGDLRKDATDNLRGMQRQGTREVDSLQKNALRGSGIMRRGVGRQVEDLQKHSVNRFSEMRKGGARESDTLKREAIGRANEMRGGVEKNVDVLKTKNLQRFADYRKGGSRESNDLKTNAISRADEMRGEVERNVDTLKTKNLARFADYRKGGSRESDDLKKNAISRTDEMRGEVGTHVDTLKTKNLARFADYRKGGSRESDELKKNASARMDEMRGSVGTDVATMKDKNLTRMAEFRDKGGETMGVAGRRMSEPVGRAKDDSIGYMNGMLEGMNKFIDETGVDVPKAQMIGGGGSAGQNRTPGTGSPVAMAEGGLLRPGGIVNQPTYLPPTDMPPTILGEAGKEAYVRLDVRTPESVEAAVAVLNSPNSPLRAREPVPGAHTHHHYGAGDGTEYGAGYAAGVGMAQGGTMGSLGAQQMHDEVVKRWPKVWVDSVNHHYKYLPADQAARSVDFFVTAPGNAAAGAERTMGDQVASFISPPSTEVAVWYDQMNYGSGWGPLSGAIGIGNANTLAHRDHVHGMAHSGSFQGGRGGAFGQTDWAAKLEKMLPKAPDFPDHIVGAAAAKMTADLRKAMVTELVGEANKQLGGPGGEGGMIPFKGDWAKAVGGGPAENRGIGKAAAEELGWGGQWPAWEELGNRESGWDRFAQNPSSGAYGIAQALPPTKYPPAAQASGGSHAGPQVGWMASYIKERYADPQGAISFHDANNWYTNGGIATRPQVAKVAENGPEFFMPLHDPASARRFLDFIEGAVQQRGGVPRGVSASGAGVSGRPDISSSPPAIAAGGVSIDRDGIRAGNVKIGPDGISVGGMSIGRGGITAGGFGRGGGFRSDHGRDEVPGHRGGPGPVARAAITMRPPRPAYDPRWTSEQIATYVNTMPDQQRIALGRRRWLPRAPEGYVYLPDYKLLPPPAPGSPNAASPGDPRGRPETLQNLISGESSGSSSQSINQVSRHTMTSSGSHTQNQTHRISQGSSSSGGSGRSGSEGIDHGTIPQDEWDRLIAAGWRGIPGDGREAIYPPRQGVSSNLRRVQGASGSRTSGASANRVGQGGSGGPDWDTMTQAMLMLIDKQQEQIDELRESRREAREDRDEGNPNGMAASLVRLIRRELDQQDAKGPRIGR